MNHLLHPEYIESIPFSGPSIATALNEHAQAFASGDPKQHDVTIAIRTLNEADQLEGLLGDIQAQDIDAGVEVVVVDNESTDGTQSVARYYGATVVNLAREDFTYPVSMNRAMDAASFDAVFLTVGHARLSNDQQLKGAARHLFHAGGTAGGAFGHTLPNSNASGVEKLISVGNKAFMKEKVIKKAGFGVLGATCAAIDKQVWLELGRFDERYESGGEDTALARQMIAQGFDVVDDPLLSAHHTHGLGLKDTVSQWAHWFKTTRGPVPLDMDKLLSRRPDINRN